MNDKANQPAFPVVMPADERRGWEATQIPGLTKREEFAKAAMNGMLANCGFGESTTGVVRKAVEMADALLLELEK